MTNWWYFSYFLYKTGLGISCKLSPSETICMKCQSSFLGKYKKIFQNVVCWKIYPECEAMKNHWIQNNASTITEGAGAQADLCLRFSHKKSVSFSHVNPHLWKILLLWQIFENFNPVGEIVLIISHMNVWKVFQRILKDVGVSKSIFHVIIFFRNVIKEL